jgi:hypothetical protein
MRASEKGGERMTAKTNRRIPSRHPLNQAKGEQKSNRENPIRNAVNPIPFNTQGISNREKTPALRTQKSLKDQSKIAPPRVIQVKDNATFRRSPGPVLYWPDFAEVAELADAPALGAGGRKAVGVRVPSSAFTIAGNRARNTSPITNFGRVRLTHFLGRGRDV